MNKSEKKPNFIRTLASSATLDSLDSPIDSIVNSDHLNSNDENIDKIESKPVSKTDVIKKGKSAKNNKEFIEDLISNFKNNTEATKEKSSLHITPDLHYKLKMLAFSTKVNLLDLTNAIIHSYLEQNKENIDAVVKKLSI